MSKPFDATMKALLEIEPKSWLTFSGIAAESVSVVDADVATITAAPDKVIRVESHEPWLLHLEFQAGPDASLPERICMYNVLLKNRHGLSVRSIAILLRREAHLNAINGIYQDVFPGDDEPQLTFHHRVLRVWEMSPEDLLNSGLGTLPLAPISNVELDEVPAVIQRMKERLDESCAPPQRRELWLSAYVLMGLRYEHATIAQLLQGVSEMEESTTYQAILTKGREEGREEGREQGREEGSVLAARRMLLQMGERKLGKPDRATQQAIEAITNLDQLQQLGMRLFDVSSWQEFLV